MTTTIAGPGVTCPVPIRDYPNILLAHGGGGTLTHQLIEKMFRPGFDETGIESRHDGAVFSTGLERMAFTTDSYVVHPLVFPGGDIGSLAVNGTVNDLAMCGARPRFLSAGFILEEGVAMETVWRVVRSMREAADAVDARIVTGDTKVVDRGKGDGIFINTAGVGSVDFDIDIGPTSVSEGDMIILSGDIGRHGIAVLSAREGLEFGGSVESDCAPLWNPVRRLLESGVDVHCLRDLTRGGLASALVEIAEVAKVTLEVEETRIPVREDVRGACEMLGLDPLYVANEGRLIAFVPARDAERATEILRGDPVSKTAEVIGTVMPMGPVHTTMKTAIGTHRVIDMLSGEQLPRIC